MMENVEIDALLKPEKFTEKWLWQPLNFRMGPFTFRISTEKNLSDEP